jgi:hypothetical protein
MSVLASRYKLALLVPIVWLGCGSSKEGDTTDYEAIRRDDDMRHSMFPAAPAATTSDGWMSLAPEPGAPLNSGVAPPTPVPEAGPEAGPPEAGPEPVPETGPNPGTPEHVITNNVYVSGGTQKATSAFFPDATATITRSGTGPLTLKSTTSAYLSFSWTSTDLDVRGFAIEFDSEPYIYVAYPSATGYSTGSYYMYITLQSTACSQLPNACYQTSLKLYAITLPADAGAGTAGASTPVTVPVIVDCGGCF